MNTPNPSHAALVAEIANLREQVRQRDADAIVAREAERQRQHILAAWNYLASGNKEMAQAELAAALV